MIRKQFFIREDQNEKLKALCARLGVSEAELIREGIDMIIRDREEEEQSWKEGLKKVLDMEGDFDDLKKTVENNRKNWNKRVDTLMQQGLLREQQKNEAS